MSTSTAAQEILAKFTPNFLRYLTDIAKTTSQELGFGIESGEIVDATVKSDVTLTVIINNTEQGRLTIDKSDGANPYGAIKYDGTLLDNRRILLSWVPKASLLPALGEGYFREDTHREIPFP